MIFEVNQAVNFRVIIGGNHIEICCKSFKQGQKSLKILDFCVAEMPRDNKMTTF